MIQVRREAICFVVAQYTRFPHREILSFLRRECINLQKGSLLKKMYLKSIFKGCIFVIKHFDQSQELQTMAK